MQRGNARHTYLLLGGILGAIVLVFVEAKTFLAAQRYIDDLAELPPIAAPDQPPASRSLSRTQATGAAAAASDRYLALRRTRLGA